MLIFWAVTPLQSAIFSNDTITAIRNVTMLQSNGLINIDQQAANLDSTFMNTAYAYTWLGQKLPAFTTPDYAVTPAYPANTSDEVLGNQTLQFPTTVYQTSLDCWPASVTQYEDVYYNISDGRGCIIPNVALAEAQDDSQLWTLTSIPYYPTDLSSHDMGKSCPNISTHTMIVLWADGSGSNDTATQINGGLTAVFCEASYYTQNATTTVFAADLSVREVNITGTRTFLEDDEFNITNFELVVSNGVSAIAKNLQFPDRLVLDQQPRLSDSGLVFPTTLEAGFAVGSQKWSLPAYKNSTNLQVAFQAAHRLLFNLAVYHVLDQTEDSHRFVFGTRTGTLGAVTVNRLISIIVEVFLGLVCILASVLWYLSYVRVSNLTSDPAAIRDIMASISGNSEILVQFTNLESLTAEHLEDVLRDGHYKLIRRRIRAKEKMCLEYVEQKGRSSSVSRKDTLKMVARPDSMDLRAVRPTELSFGLGTVFVGIICMALAGVIALKACITRQGGKSISETRKPGKSAKPHCVGLPLPSSNPVIRQILESYLPTAFSTFLEPFWVVLNRLLCILRPFEELREGGASSAISLDVKYTSVPPQLAIYRAVRSKHLILAAVCSIAFLANVLAVSLSGLLTEGIATFSTSVAVADIVSPVFVSNVTQVFGVSGPSLAGSDQFYIAMTNITSNTFLPPWTDPGFYYMPFDLEQAQTTSSDGVYHSVTRGFGMNLTCSALSTDSEKNTLYFDVSEMGQKIEFNIAHELDNGTKLSCVDFLQANGHNADTTTNYTEFLEVVPSAAPVALEVVSALRTATNHYGTTLDDLYCGTVLAVGWARMGGNETADVTTLANNTNGRSLEYEFLSCQPMLKTAMFNLTTGEDGRILESSQIGGFDSSDAFISPDDTIFLYQQMNSLIAFGSLDFVTSSLDFTWHSNTSSSDWLNYLITAITNDTDLVNPQASLPNLTSTAPIVEDLYARLAAIIFSLNPSAFQPAAPYSTTRVILTTQQTRIFMSDAMFIVTLILLSFNILVAIAFYARRPPKYLPRMPTTIASIIAYVAASHALSDFDPAASVAQGLSAKGLRRDSMGSRYAYGRFVGTDGKTHVGIERQSLVVPLESRPPGEPGEWSVAALRRRITGKEKVMWI